ncbi:hypothetical protein VCSRO127_0482 [Vibrio cholerae]|nr:hypothetical protein VCSRO127_0482 [Vibrio cholerae]
MSKPFGRGLLTGELRFIGRYLAAKAAWSVFLGRYPLPDCPAYAGFLVSLDKKIINEIDAVL